MKDFITITATVLFIYSCAPKSYQDTRPKEQRSLIEKFAELDSAITATDQNQFVQEQKIDSSMVAINNFVTDSLNKEFKGWLMKVINIKTDLNDAVKVECMISKEPYTVKELAEYSSMILSTYFNGSNPKDVEILKKLEVGRMILADGTFKSKDNHGIDINSYSMSNDIFDNPEIAVEINSIRFEK